MKDIIIRFAALALALLSALGAILFQAMKPASPVQVSYPEIRWHDLTPKEWDPTKRFRELNLDAMKDGDPQTNRVLLDMRATWDNAPTVGALDGVGVKLAGYVVPLEGHQAAMKEFLLVPYFGACVHSPPPPANQIVHVIAGRPAQGLRTMAPVWVSGKMKVSRQDTVMGVSGYSIAAETIQPYGGPP